MVRFLSFIIMLFLTSPLLGQINCDTIGPRWYDPPMYTADDKWSKLGEFFAANLIYPETAIEDKIEGMVFVQFWIDSNGYTSKHTIYQGIRQDLDDEALRVVRLVRFEIPAKSLIGGQPIGVCFQLPVTFRLNDPEFLFYKQSEKIKPKSKKRCTRSGNP
ncbi:MAG: energy transducer TonB [Bacteroidetes bacterium]|nr:energy transducer TonB [Bacteroidota bacterium]MCL2301758.1 energy transducer TonB [Lentimicrobiaceae bacterium]